VFITILLVDADTHRGEALEFTLHRNGYHILTAATPDRARTTLDAHAVDLILLDLETLPVATIRALSPAPLIAIANSYHEAQMEDAYDSGTDDYMMRPFPLATLLCRVRALLRLAQGRGVGEPEASSATAIAIGGARYDPINGCVSAQGVSVYLTRRQGLILSLLARHPGQAFSANRLRELLWDQAAESDLGVVKAYIRNIRRRLASLPGLDDPIRTVPGWGYTIDRGTPINGPLASNDDSLAGDDPLIADAIDMPLVFVDRSARRAARYR